MVEIREQRPSVLMDVSNALVRLHKEQFGRGATRARTYWAGPDSLVCVLEEVLLPAERKLVAMGASDQVRESRASFQVATAPEFVETVEEIVDRKVHAFASAIDADSDVVFENFWFESHESGANGAGPSIG